MALQRDLLIESVLEPSRQIVEGYRTTVVSLADGRILTGVVKRESSNVLTLVDATGQATEVRKSEIDGRKLGDASIMPSLPRANPAATVAALAHRLADLIQ